MVWPRGATRMARGGIRLVHGLTKSTLITYFSGMKNRPYTRFACIFLNLPVMFFPKFVYMTKNRPFFPILHVFAPLNDVCAYSAWSWKTTLITWIFRQAKYPPWHSSGPLGGLAVSYEWKWVKSYEWAAVDICMTAFFILEKNLYIPAEA